MENPQYSTTEVTQMIKMTSQRCDYNPLWDIPHFDINTQSPPEIFHLEIIGLLRSHFVLLWDKGFPLGSKAYNQGVARARVQLLEDSSIPDLDFGGWTGSSWISFLQVSPFVMCGLVEDGHYQCWVVHCKYLLLILQCPLSRADLHRARTMCVTQFRPLFRQLYGELARFPNNHQIVHLFDAIEPFGPPVLWWVQTFEMKHKTFKSLADHSNKHNLTTWCSLKENVFQTLRFVQQNVPASARHAKPPGVALSPSQREAWYQQLVAAGFNPAITSLLFQSSSSVSEVTLNDSCGNEIETGMAVELTNGHIAVVDGVFLVTLVQNGITNEIPTVVVRRLQKDGSIFANTACFHRDGIPEVVTLQTIRRCVSLVICFDNPSLICVNGFVRWSLLI